MTAHPSYFQQTADLLHDIFNLPFQVLCDGASIQAFCRENQHAAIQTWLNPDALSGILEQSSRQKIHIFEDALHVRVILFYPDGLPVIAGPYLSSAMQASDCLSLISRFELHETAQEEMLIYFGRYPVLPERQMEKILYGFLRAAKMYDLPVSYTIYTANREDGDALPDPERVSNANLERHYMTERLFMDSIRQGNYKNAMQYLSITQETASSLWYRNTGMNDRRIGAAITRAMARVAAYEAGVPAPIIHKITTKESLSISTAVRPSQIDQAARTMLQEFCSMIRESREKNYSALVQSVLYSLRQGYADPVSMAELAEEMAVTESYMIRRFREETGTSPAAFLNQLRLENACLLLSSSHETIQVISSRVGIPDANYFSRIFKKQYGMTPVEYRRKHRI